VVKIYHRVIMNKAKLVAWITFTFFLVKGLVWVAIFSAAYIGIDLIT